MFYVCCHTSESFLGPKWLNSDQSFEFKLIPKHSCCFHHYDTFDNRVNLTRSKTSRCQSCLQIPIYWGSIDFYGKPWHRHGRVVVELHARDKFWFHPYFSSVIDYYKIILQKVNEVLQTEQRVSSAFLNNNLNYFAFNFLNLCYCLPFLAQDPYPVFALLLGFYCVVFVNNRSHIRYLFNIGHLILSSIEFQKLD